MSKITPCLWFDDRIDEAVKFYVSVFGDASVGNISRYGEGGPRPAGTILTAHFVLAGQEFMALNGGPGFPFTQAVSFFVSCETQAEVDRFWDALTADGGEEGRCGWLKDKFGLSWQIVPNALPKLLGDPDRAKAGRALQAMMQMKKLDIAALERARNG